MKAECCGQRLSPNHENKLYFKKKCNVCGKIYKQNKRQPSKPKPSK